MYYPEHFCYASEDFRDHVQLSTTYFRMSVSRGEHIHKDQVETVDQKTNHKIHQEYRTMSVMWKKQPSFRILKKKKKSKHGGLGILIIYSFIYFHEVALLFSDFSSQLL